MRLVPIDMEGMNLVLGGGVPLLTRHESFAGESTTIMVRGPSGSGKTAFGSELATSLARALAVDVAYACVGLLPAELAAQRASLTRPDTDERVVEPPFLREDRSAACRRVYAGALDLGTRRDEQVRLVPALDGLITAIRDVGGVPGVLVVDALSDGYRLGGAVPRRLADDLCKMAMERGQVLILLEETTRADPSPWCSAADVVIELDLGALPNTDPSASMLHRRARFTKNRFGPCELGPHHLEMIPGSGVHVSPNAATYTRPWATSIVLPGRSTAPAAWTWGALSKLAPKAHAALTYFAFDRCVSHIRGGTPGETAQWAMATGELATPSVDVLLSFGVEPTGVAHEIIETPSLFVVPLGTLLTSEPVARSLGALSRIAAQNTVGRVLLGDLSRVREAWSRERVMQMINAIVYFCKLAALPVVLLETLRDTMVRPFLDFVDVGLHAHAATRTQAKPMPMQPLPPVAMLSLLRLGMTIPITDSPPTSAAMADLAKFL